MTATGPHPLAIARWLLDLAVVGLVAVVLLAVILGRLAPIFGGQSLIIGGPSMEPTLPLGSVVVIQPVKTDAIAVGDIVSVQSGDGRAIYTHRVTRLLSLQGEPYLETKGDNNETADAATVPAAAVIGRVDRVVLLMGYMLALLSIPSGVAFVLGLGVLLILGAILIDAVEDDRRRARRRSAVTTSAAEAPGPTPVTGGGRAVSEGSLASVAALVQPRDRRPELGTEPRPPAPTRHRQRRHPSATGPMA